LKHVTPSRTAVSHSFTQFVPRVRPGVIVTPDTLRIDGPAEQLVAGHGYVDGRAGGGERVQERHSRFKRGDGLADDYSFRSFEFGGGQEDAFAVAGCS
jgi:hypothetical protein